MVIVTPLTPSFIFSNLIPLSSVLSLSLSFLSLNFTQTHSAELEGGGGWSCCNSRRHPKGSHWSQTLFELNLVWYKCFSRSPCIMNLDHAIPLDSSFCSFYNIWTLMIYCWKRRNLTRRRYNAATSKQVSSKTPNPFGTNLTFFWKLY